jgi:hypothetical protein
MNMSKVQHEVIVEEWKHKIIECRNSGLPVVRWCKENNVKENRYYYWLNVIRNEMLTKSKYAGNQSGNMTIFAQVPAQTLLSAEGICATIRVSGLAVEIHNGASHETIGAIMQTLRATC